MDAARKLTQRRALGRTPVLVYPLPRRPATDGDSVTRRLLMGTQGNTALPHPASSRAEGVVLVSRRSQVRWMSSSVAFQPARRSASDHSGMRRVSGCGTRNGSSWGDEPALRLISEGGSTGSVWG